ncbi:uncharacterized protein [Diadema antillarum]|uniref:uncharacterized protein n=1 Tax=Diadema antillarum TaxID=105358 RepID=UPI003A86C63D
MSEISMASSLPANLETAYIWARDQMEQVTRFPIRVPHLVNATKQERANFEQAKAMERFPLPLPPQLAHDMNIGLLQQQQQQQQQHQQQQQAQQQQQQNEKAINNHQQSSGNSASMISSQAAHSQPGPSQPPTTQAGPPTSGPGSGKRGRKPGSKSRNSQGHLTSPVTGEPRVRPGPTLEDMAGDGREYRCKICPQVYYSKSDVLLHARSHKEGKPYKCDDCGKAFASTSYVNQHMKVHTNEKPYQCTFCEKTFKQLSHLQQHTRIHTGERPYRCNQPGCEKSFTQLSNLQQHWRRHNKDKPYKCRDCYRAFDDLEMLQNHSHSHENNRREKRFSCGVCGKSYVQELYLMKHMEKHPHVVGQTINIINHTTNSVTTVTPPISSAHTNPPPEFKPRRKKKRANRTPATTACLDNPMPLPPVSVMSNSNPSLERNSYSVPPPPAPHHEVRQGSETPGPSITMPHSQSAQLHHTNGIMATQAMGLAHNMSTTIHSALPPFHNPGSLSMPLAGVNPVLSTVYNMAR